MTSREDTATAGITDSNVTRVQVASGRWVGVWELSTGQRTVVFCHPTPGSGRLDPQPDVTALRDVTLLGVDRPGYGASDPTPVTERVTLERAAEDLAEVLDERGVGSVGVVGWSTGGWVSLALAAHRPHLVDRVVLLGTPAPEASLPWMPEAQWGQLDTTPQDTHRSLGTQLQALLDGKRPQGLSLDLLCRSAADDLALQVDGAEERLNRMLGTALERGTAGLTADITGFLLHPLGFEPGEVQAKTLLLYGSRDPVAGGKHATWWKRRLPNARVEMVPGEGHLLLMRHWARVLSHVAPHSMRS